MTRKLATIRKITDLHPIDGADFLELAIVDGWQCVVKKGQFEKDELIVFCEIDSVLPIHEDLEFLRKGCYVKKDWLVSEENPTGEGFRLRTIKLRGQISQGLLLDLDFLKKITVDKEIKSIGWVEGLDVTDWCGIVKWDPPIPANLAGKVRGNFPSFCPKTDQERVQNLKPRDLERFQGGAFEATIKLDGSSMTVYWNEGRMGVCSRNLDLDWENDDSTLSRVAREYGFKEFFEHYNCPIAFQGELCGPGIQGNREGLKEAEFFLFDIYAINRGTYVDCDERYEWHNTLVEFQRFNGFKVTPHVPYLYSFVLDNTSVEEFLELAKGSSLNNPIREGLVFKSLTDPNFSFKAISNEYLLETGG